MTRAIAKHFELNAGQIAVGMPAQWKGKPDAATGVVFASQPTID